MINKYIKYSQSEKMEVINIVKNSKVSAKITLKELDISESTFYEWVRRYNDEGFDGLRNNPKTPFYFWNKIPDHERKKIIQIAREYPEKSCRELAFYITDNLKYFVSESSVYRILKEEGLISSPAFTVISAKDKFENPTTRVNEMWQTDFTYFKIVNWGWYYLSTVLDDYSRYIVSWKLCDSMTTEDVKLTLDEAIERTGVGHIKIIHKPILLSDNGPSYISKELDEYIKEKEMKQVHGRPYHPQTQGKIERYHRSMKNIILLDNYYTPEELKKKISEWVNYYNNLRYHEALGNITPADKYSGKEKKIFKRRSTIKIATIKKRRKLNKKNCA